MKILCLNPGSGTLRHRLIDIDRAREIEGGMIDGVQGDEVADAATELANDYAQQTIDAIGFRVVHGGTKHFQPTRIDQSLLEDLESVVDLAPLHLPTDLAVIRTVTQHLKSAAFAVFDTGFHQTLPELAYRYPIPQELGERYRRFGFHGMAHQFVSEAFRKAPGDFDHNRSTSRIISLHVGGGASLCAVQDGRSVATTMGMTPLEGLMMSTRSGSVDPGLVLELIRRGRTVDQVDELLNRQSGLKGLSRMSSDTREILPAAENGNTDCQLALDVYADRVRQAIGAYIAVLGGCDALVISGALVKESPPFRQKLFGQLECFGIQLDSGRNEAVTSERRARLSSDASPVTVALIPADEEMQIAKDVARVFR